MVLCKQKVIKMVEQTYENDPFILIKFLKYLDIILEKEKKKDVYF